MSETITVEAFPPGERRFIRVENTEIAIINHDGTYHAFKNWCPHMGAPLGKGYVSTPNDMESDTPKIACPFHSWRFDIESGKSTFSDLKVPTFDIVREGTEIHIQLK